MIVETRFHLGDGNLIELQARAALTGLIVGGAKISRERGRDGALERRLDSAGDDRAGNIAKNAFTQLLPIVSCERRGASQARSPVPTSPVLFEISVPPA